MSASVVILLLLLTAALGIAVGYLLARTRSAGLVHRLELERTNADSRAAALEQQLGQQRQDGDTAARLKTLDRQLQTLQQQVFDAEKSRAESHAALRAQLHSHAELTRLATDEVQREARKLSKALTRSNVRGFWGESELQRLVEAAGMLERVHFDTQTTVGRTDERKRPDMIVHLAGGRDIVVDAKVPLDALLEDCGADSESYPSDVLQRHAAALKTHIDTLASRKYSDLLPDSPELVVLYLPAESLLSLALAADAGLLDHAFARGVALATPTTMLALLRTVNHGWRQESVAQNARDIHALGLELHKRLATMSGHLRKVGTSLDGAVKAFNLAIGSYETRVLPQARKFEDMELVGETIPATAAIETSPRALTVATIDVTDGPPVRALGS